MGGGLLTTLIPMDINDKLILDRDIKQLSQEFSNLTDRMERLKREQLDILDLNKKEKDRLEKLQKDLTTTNKEIAEAKIKWANEKREQEDEIIQEKSAATKIINRENFLKLEEQKLAKFSLGLDERKKALTNEENQRSEKESALKLREITLEKKEQSYIDKVLEFEKSISEISETVINHANKWPTKLQNMT